MFYIRTSIFIIVFTLVCDVTWAFGKRGPTLGYAETCGYEVEELPRFVAGDFLRFFQEKIEIYWNKQNSPKELPSELTLEEFNHICKEEKLIRFKDTAVPIDMVMTLIRDARGQNDRFPSTAIEDEEFVVKNHRRAFENADCRVVDFHDVLLSQHGRWGQIQFFDRAINKFGIKLIL